MVTPRGRCGYNNNTTKGRVRHVAAMEKIVRPKGGEVVMVSPGARAAGRGAVALLVVMSLPGARSAGRACHDAAMAMIVCPKGGVVVMASPGVRVAGRGAVAPL